MQSPHLKIVFIGTTGSGKSTLGRRAAALLGCQHTDLDDLFWLPEWRKREETDFRHDVLAATAAPSFVMSGNYFTIVSADLWPKADTLVWVDYSFWRIFWQINRRTWQRLRDKNSICNGNYETWGKVLSADGILVWLFKSYRRNKKRYSAIFKDRHYPNLTYIRLANPKQVTAFLSSLERESS